MNGRLILVDGVPTETDEPATNPMTEEQKAFWGNYRDDYKERLHARINNANLTSAEVQQDRDSANSTLGWTSVPSGRYE